MDDSAEVVPKPSLAVADAGGDALFTLSDLPAWLYAAYFLPGDWLLWAISSRLPSVASFLEIGAADYGGVLSGFISTCAWLLLLVSGSIAYQFVRDADRAMTRGIAELCADVGRRARIAAALLRTRMRRRRRAPPEKIEVAEDLELSRDELKALQLYGELQPGYALAVSDVAAALQARSHQVQRLLERLKQLGLLGSTVGGLEGESAYTLTRAGRALLIFRKLAPAQ
jgi:hypothetical protein